jgi:hypothetical protein
MRGRRPTGPAYVWKLEGSPVACRRLEAILQTLGGGQSVQQACAGLGVAATRFHQLRQEALQAALASLEPGQAGRPSRRPQDPRISQLQAEVRELRLQLQAASVRAELAALLPRLAEGGAATAEEGEGKKARRRRPSRSGRRRSQ